MIYIMYMSTSCEGVGSLVLAELKPFVPVTKTQVVRSHLDFYKDLAIDLISSDSLSSLDLHVFSGAPGSPW